MAMTSKTPWTVLTHSVPHGIRGGCDPDDNFCSPILGGTGDECLKEQKEAEQAADAAALQWETVCKSKETSSHAQERAYDKFSQAKARGEAARRQIVLLQLALKLGEAEEGL
jgi:hypothetical protein